MAPQASTFTQYAPQTTTTREVGAPVYVSGQASEVMGSPVINTVRQEQVVAGSVSQNVVEIPTVQEVVQVQEIPELQTVERIEEIVQTVQRPVEQIVEQRVEVPKIIPQERVQQRTVEQIVDVPVPQVVEEIVEVAKIIPQERVQQRTVEQVIDVPVPQIQEVVRHVEVPGPVQTHEVVKYAQQAAPTYAAPEIGRAHV